MKTVIIAGGGTGGHIYPGIAIARALQKKDPSLQIHFVGTDRGLEKKIVPKEGFPLHLISSGQLNLKGEPLKILKTLFALPWGFLQSVKLLFQLRPMYVLGVGGYASGPFVLMASLLGYRTGLWEGNAIPGMTNRILAKFVKRCFVVFPEAANSFPQGQAIVAGMPVRAEVLASTEKRPADGEFHILHYGGSQGSRMIGTALCDAVIAGGDWLRGTKIVHQTGAVDFEKFKERYQGQEARVEVQPFIYNMDHYYRWADVVVCRGGASTLSEIAAFGLPAIVIPLPVADGHQEKNATSLQRAGAARVILQKDLSPERLVTEILALKGDEQLRKQLALNVKAFHLAGAAEKIAEEILNPSAT